MKLAWLFGNTMEQRHLLYVYLSVWIIQGGYCAWIGMQWLRSRRDRPFVTPATSEGTDGSDRKNQ